MAFPNIIGPDKFAGGVLTYNDRFGNDPNTRIVIPVIFEDLLATTAVLDTGAPWCVLNPYDAEVLNLENRADCWGSSRPLALRGFKYQGRLCRIPVSFEADRGMGMTVESTVFIPKLAAHEEWLHPNFLGLDGLLNRIRFAIDPDQNHFYFGPSGS